METSLSLNARAEQTTSPHGRGLFRLLWSRPRWWIQFLIGLAASAIFLFFALRGADFGTLWRILGTARPDLLALAVGMGMAASLIRAVRWQVLFAGTSRPRLRFLFTSMMIGYLANNVLPARLGELVRIYVLHRRTGMSKSTSAATIILERLVDLLFLLVVLAALSFSLLLPLLHSGAGIVLLAGLAASAGFLLLLAFRGSAVIHLVTRLAERFSPAIARRVQGMSERFLTGLQILRSGRQSLAALGLTVGTWFIEAVFCTLVMRSLSLDVPWSAPLLTMVLVSLSFVIPAAPGALGTYEFFVVLSMKPYGVDPNLAVGLALLLHAMVYGISTLLGLACLWSESLSLSGVVAGSQTGEKNATDDRA